MKKTFAEKRFFKWQEDEIAVSLRNHSGSYGGGSEVLIVDTLVFDASQITSPINGNIPKWGGACHSLHQNANRAVVIIKEYDRTDNIHNRHNDEN